MMCISIFDDQNDHDDDDNASLFDDITISDNTCKSHSSRNVQLIYFIQLYQNSTKSLFNLLIISEE
jgi:hypothetical protein